MRICGVTLPARRRKPEPRFLHRVLSARDQFLLGIACILAWTFQLSIPIMLGQLASFLLLARLAGKRIRYGYFLGFILAITLFNLLTPLGRVILEIGPFVVTQGALELGIRKGLTIVGLVFISLFSIRRDLVLPGRLGALLGRSFLYFERLLDARGGIQPRRLVASIDEALDRLLPISEIGAAEAGGVTAGEMAGSAEAGNATTALPGSATRSSVAGLAFAAAYFLANAAALAIGLLSR